MVRRLLCQAPHKRPKAHEALDLPWVASRERSESELRQAVTSRHSVADPSGRQRRPSAEAVGSRPSSSSSAHIKLERNASLPGSTSLLNLRNLTMHKRMSQPSSAISPDKASCESRVSCAISALISVLSHFARTTLLTLYPLPLTTKKARYPRGSNTFVERTDDRHRNASCSHDREAGKMVVAWERNGAPMASEDGIPWVSTPSTADAM